jgi:hypothetical protein
MIRRRYQVALAALLVVGVVAAIAIWVTRPAQLTLSMRPVLALTTAACASEVHAHGYAVSVGTSMCQPGAACAGEPHAHGYAVSVGTSMCQPDLKPRWYHAVLVNNGSYALVACSATGYDSGGNAIFHGTLPFTFAGPDGLFAGHGRTAFYWFLPQPVTGPVARYAASCSVSPNQF